MRGAQILLATIALLIMAPPGLGDEAPTLRRIVVTGQPVPGGGEFDRFGIESLPVVAPVNSRGHVAFFATVARGTATEGIFLAADGRITRIAAEGDRVPGAGTISGFGRHPTPGMSESGAVAFAAAVAGGKTVEGIFASSRSRLRTVAVAGQPAPDVPSGTLAALDAPALNDQGDIAFLASVRRGRETVEAIYLHSRGKLRKLVGQGEPAPAGGVFAGFGPPVLNNRGLVAFGAVVEGRAVPGGVFLWDGKQVRMLVGAGDEAPLGGVFAKFSERVALNDAGAVAFTSVLKNAPAAAGVFAVENARLRTVAALGAAAPGGGTFSYFGLWPALSTAGVVAFTASVDGGTSPVGVFVVGAAGSRRVAGVGDRLPDGARLATLTLYPAVSMSAAGDVTFAAAPSATGEGVEGIFLAAAPRPH